MHKVHARVEALAAVFEEHAAQAENLGRLPDPTVAAMRDAGVIRLLQPKAFGGHEAHPAEWLETVIALGSRCGSAGWVSGVVGVHPWHLALYDSRAQQEVWGEDSETWIASPYAPSGAAMISDDGYILKGRWSFSSGTDHCKWIFLGAIVVDGEGKPTQSPPRWIHLLLPRKDYEIVDGSWQVMGLKGSGSKDIVVDGAYVPGYRTLETFLPRAPGDTLWERAGRTETLYKLPFGLMFSLAIASGVLAASEGVLGQFVAYQKQRLGRAGTPPAHDPHARFVFAEAASDIHAGRVQVLDDISRIFDLVDRGQEIPLEQRAAARRNHVRAARRSADAADRLFAAAGGGALRLDTPLQRLWRDTHAGLQHGLNVAGTPYEAYAAAAFGQPLPPGAVF